MVQIFSVSVQQIMPVNFLRHSVRQGMHMTIKWSKLMQSRDKVHTIVLPKLHPSILCPVMVLKAALASYAPSLYDPLFQVRTSQGYRCY